MSAAFQDAWFDPAGPVGHLVGGNVGQDRVVHGTRVMARTRRKQHPGRQDALASQGETQMARLFLMNRSGRGDHFADQIVGQEGHPQFPPDHLRRLAADVVQVQRLFDLGVTLRARPRKA